VTALAPVPAETFDLRTLVDRATTILVYARTAAEILEAREIAGLAYDVAKRASRLQRAKDAHDALIGAAHRAQAHALEIEAQVKHRLADEYGAAQERGEVATGSVRTDIVPDENDVRPATAAELGLSRKDIHEARLIRDAERADPGIVRRTLDEQLARGEEPTRAALRRAVATKLDRALANLKAAAEERERVGALPKAPPLAEAERARQIAVFGTQEDRAILARIDELVERIAEQPCPAEAVRRIPPASEHAVQTPPIREAVAWLEAFCSIFEKEKADGRTQAE
jgi:hypothetical protein